MYNVPLGARAAVSMLVMPRTKSHHAVVSASAMAPTTDSHEPMCVQPACAYEAARKTLSVTHIECFCVAQGWSNSNSRTAGYE